jgi:hypothetical protein
MFESDASGGASNPEMRRRIHERRKERRLEKGGDAMRRRVRGDPWEWLFSC